LRGRPTCQICGYRNHTTVTCHRWYQGNSYPGPPARASTPPLANMVAAQTPSSSWFLDTAANYHIQPNTHNLTAVNEYTGPDQLVVGNGQGLQITHTSNGNLHTPTSTLILKMFYVFLLSKKKLLSVQKFTSDNSFFFEFSPHYFLIKDQCTKKILLHRPSEEGVYKCRLSTPAANTVIASTSLTDWHAALGHPNICKLKDLVHQQHIHSTDTMLSPCSSCRLGKLAKVLIASRTHTSTMSFQLVFSDVWGSTPV
jgi:hypothetical protein